jgi:hypothetical protein
MRKGLLVSAAALLVLGASSTAFGGTAAVPSQVVYDRSGEVSNPPGPDRDSFIFGHVKSKVACLGNRKVVILGGYANEPKYRPYDVARTGDGGGFMGLGPIEHNGNALSTWKLILKPKSIGTNQHPKTCKGDKELVL